MKRRAMVLMACAASLMLPAKAEDAPKCQLVRYVSLPITLEVAGRPVIPLKLDDHDVNMLVDTGAFYSVISEQAVERLHLALRAHPQGGLVGFGGHKENRYVRINALHVGPVALRDRLIFLDPWKQKMGSFDGLLGGEVMQVFELDFDFSNGKLGFFAQSHCPGKVVYWTNDPHAEIPFELDSNNHIVIDVTLDGKTVKAIVDTGASGTVMSLETAESLFDGIDDKALQEDDGRYPFKTLDLKGVAVSNPVIRLMSNETTKTLGGSGRPKMILGMNVLRQLHLFISYKERIIYATPAGAHK